MATLFQGFEVLGFFSYLFPFLLVLFILYAILAKTQILSENNSLNAIVALVFAVLLVVSKSALVVVNTMIPWFVLLIIFVLFLLMIVKTFGYDDNAIKEAVSGRGYIMTTLIIVALIIFVGALASVFGQDLLNRDTGIDENGVNQTGQSSDFETNLWDTLFHPKVLGLIVIVLVSTFALKFLTDPSIT